MALSSKDARLRGQIGGLMNSATHDMKQVAQRARDGRWQRYLDKVDAMAPGLDEKERNRRATALQSADMRKMALKRWPNKKPCAWCEAEAGRTIPRDQTSTVCATHRVQVDAEYLAYKQNAPKTLTSSGAFNPLARKSR